MRAFWAHAGPLLLPAGLLLAGQAGGLAAQLGRDLTAFIVVALLQGAVWAIAVIIVMRNTDLQPALTLVLGTAVLLRLIALATPIFLSDDINRYVWDGRVQAAGINPYRYIPTDPHLAPLRDDAIFPNINRNNYAPTIYPPVAQVLFLLANRVGETALAVKLTFVAIEVIGIGALVYVLHATGRPRGYILFYAWHPLPVWEIAGSGHVDAAIVAFVVLALAAAVAGRRAWSGAALAAATLVKFFPLVLAPALWRPAKSNRGDWRWPAAFLAVIAAAYLPYIGVGPRVVGFLPGYVAEENLASGSGFWLLDTLRHAFTIPLSAYLGLAMTVMAGLAVGALRKSTHSIAGLRWATALATAAMFFASPHYPWYFVCLVALLTIAPWWPAWWLTLSAVLLYWEAKAGTIPRWTGFAIYGGFIILGAVDLIWRSFFMVRSGAQHGIDRAI